ncbi:MAG: GWxTD domain-containing protein [Bacteroidales bacterium]|nr:GWxTD domain-containing protein [Bacteroidales bacterium]
MKKKHIFIVIFILFFASCLTQKPQRTKTSASEYNPASFVLHPQFKLFHVSDSYSKLYLKLFTNELRFSSANEDRVNQAIIKIKYIIKPSVKNNTVLDSSQTTLKIKKTENQTSIISFFKIKNIKQEHYIIEIKMVDTYANKKSHSFIRVNNSDDDNEQYYFSLKVKNKKPVFTQYFRLSDSLIIMHKNTLINKIQIKHFKNNFSEAVKPSDTQEQNSLRLKADTSWHENAVFGKIPFKVKKRGIYLIKADTFKHKGMLKVNFSNTYPLLTKSSELVKATKYLTSDEEYSRMMQSDNKKLSIDNFWLQAVKNKERAREILKIWYNRATYANYYFTSYKEGWKTDRGMIYMVYGPPDDIKNFDDAEKWIYINSKEDQKLEFIFVIPEQAISKNDFILLRDAKYITSWNRAVKSWRSGTVYHY